MGNTGLVNRYTAMYKEVIYLIGCDCGGGFGRRLIIYLFLYGIAQAVKGMSVTLKKP